ncbi:MAG: helix-turn-helix transcriptional regulator [Elusimicrobiota bacterium]
MKNKGLLETVARGIREWRDRRGLTIEQLAGASGVDAGYLSHITIGRKSPSLKTLEKIARGLGVAPEELFRGSGEKEGGRRNDMDRRFAAILRSMTRGQKADLLAALSKLRDPQKIKGLRLLLKT